MNKIIFIFFILIVIVLFVSSCSVNLMSNEADNRSDANASVNEVKDSQPIAHDGFEQNNNAVSSKDKPEESVNLSINDKDINKEGLSDNDYIDADDVGLDNIGDLFEDI